MFEDAVWFLVCCLWWTQVSWGKQMNNKFGHWEMEYLYNYIWLMVLTILKNMKVNGKDDITYMKWKKKKCLKPPPRYDITLSLLGFIPWLEWRKSIRFGAEILLLCDDFCSCSGIIHGSPVVMGPPGAIFELQQ